jgi:hypothetical protein
MEQSNSWEANSRAGIQEFSNILWYLKVQYHHKKSRQLTYILSQMNPLHNPILFI